jgi:adenylate cyclase
MNCKGPAQSSISYSAIRQSWSRSEANTMLINHRTPAVAGVGAMSAFLVAILLMPAALREGMRETAFDLILAADQRWRKTQPQHRDAHVVVIDIDRRSIEALGAWPWPRETIARLIESVAVANPAAIAIDVLFAEPDGRSPAALARQLGVLIDRPELTRLAEALPDGDKRLAKAARDFPLALGFVLSPDQSEAPSGVPILMRGSPTFGPLWSVAGAVGPHTMLMDAANGLGTLSLPGDADGTVRRVPLLVLVGDTLRPGIAAEAVRLARQASTYLIQSNPLRLTIGDISIPLTDDALLRLAPLGAATSTYSAADVLAGDIDAQELTGSIILVGSSAPELGGLRTTAMDPLTPSVQIHSHAVRQMLDGRVPRSLAPKFAAELGAVLALGAIAVAAVAGSSPLVGALIILSAIMLTWIMALGFLLISDRLFDPLTPSLGAAITFVVASVASFAHTQWREALVRRRFEQHLAPAVVSRIVQDPRAVKLSGERREVTALFTDVEGFTTITQDSDPERLVAVLDSYFEGLAAIVIAHGGMVDKIVGDGVHALFNAPLDLEGHPRRAVDCAVAIRSWSKEYQRLPETSALRFGRTRVGVETGSVVVGDVGVRAKLDYTAHGDAMNVTSRLEAANKELGSTICVGPIAAARCDPTLLRPLGVIAARGRKGSLAVYEPWPEDAPMAWRENYLEAFRLIASDRGCAIKMFEILAAERDDDPVPARMAERLRAN